MKSGFFFSFAQYNLSTFYLSESKILNLCDFSQNTLLIGQWTFFEIIPSHAWTLGKDSPNALGNCKAFVIANVHH